VRIKQVSAVAISVAIVLAAYLTWQTTTGSFNPNPNTLSLETDSCSPSAPPCPVFRIDSANLTVRTLQDIVSQELNVRISALGPTPLSSLSVYFANHPIGNLSKVILPGETVSAGWAIPTTLTVNQGERYIVLVESGYIESGTPGSPVEYWSTINVTAS
jgi:hypothetical protein